MSGRRLLPLLILAAAAACREKGRPDPNIGMVISHSREEVSRPPAGAPQAPAQLVVPPEVERAYSAIRLSWKDASTKKEGILEVPLAGTATIPDSELTVRADVFLPAFTMDAARITSSSIEPENPAARITVVEKRSELFGGWIFQRFPDVHPFAHPRFSLRLVGGVRRK